MRISAPSIYDIQAALCQTMANTVRLQIVHALRDAPLRVSDLAQRTGLSQSTISRHLGVLRTGGVVVAERLGADHVYRITNPKIVAICDLMREVLSEEASRRSRLVKDW